MTTPTAPAAATHPLVLLAYAAEIDTTHATRSESPQSYSSMSAGPSTSPEASYREISSDGHLHIPCSSPESKVPPPTRIIPLKQSSSSNTGSPLIANQIPTFIRHKPGRRSRKTTDSSMKMRLEMKKKRRELLERANKIKSLDNSPVNERQLNVLRMVYDEITMYPPESWMVLIAIVINRCALSQLKPSPSADTVSRSFKQVKNWFSNERQKNRSGDSIPFETDDGDKVRLRADLVPVCQEWSDAFFHEILMIHNFRLLCESRLAP